VFIHVLLATRRHVDSSLWRRTWCSPSTLSCVGAGIPGHLRITLALTSWFATCSGNPSVLGNDLCLFGIAKYDTLSIVRQHVYQELVPAIGTKCNLEATYYSAYTPVSYIVLQNFDSSVWKWVLCIPCGWSAIEGPFPSLSLVFLRSFSGSICAYCSVCIERIAL